MEVGWSRVAESIAPFRKDRWQTLDKSLQPIYKEFVLKVADGMIGLAQRPTPNSGYCLAILVAAFQTQ